ncbi:MAG: VWA domain-containing protein [Proteobacteria bacterium]|nr:VWA domain-containing protein [Pseudomonadota bacterium]
MGWTQFVTDLRFDMINLGISLLGMITVLPAMMYVYFRKKTPARIRFSSLRNIKTTPRMLKVRMINLPFFLRLLTVSMLFIAFSHPYLEREVKKDRTDTEKKEKNEKQKEEYKKIEVPTEGISIQLIIDRSGSMGVHPGRDGIKFNYMKFENALLSKLDVVKIISKRFIKGTQETNKDASYFTGRGNDLIGLYTFARYPFVACPLTLRHELLLDYISQLDFVKLREEDGTYIGYALERAILQIIETKSRAKEEDAYNIKSSVIILVTDGEQIIRPEDSQDRHKSLLPSEAAALAKDNGIKIYAIAISPRQIYNERGTVIQSINTNFSTEEIKKAALLAGGQFFMAQDGNALLKIYQEINSLEKSIIPSKKELEVRIDKTKDLKKIETEKVEFFNIFLWAGLLMFICEILMSTLYFRRIP